MATVKIKKKKKKKYGVRRSMSNPRKYTEEPYPYKYGKQYEYGDQAEEGGSE